jgi:hypothetical protein
VGAKSNDGAFGLPLKRFIQWFFSNRLSQCVPNTGRRPTSFRIIGRPDCEQSLRVPGRLSLSMASLRSEEISNTSNLNRECSTIALRGLERTVGMAFAIQHSEVNDEPCDVRDEDTPAFPELNAMSPGLDVIQKRPNEF